MKLERERDIPAFKGKTWRQRIALRSRAKERDRSIIWHQMLINASTIAPLLALSHWLAVQFFQQQRFTVFVVSYLVLTYPVLMILNVLFITPKIRKALESDIPSSGL